MQVHIRKHTQESITTGDLTRGTISGLHRSGVFRRLIGHNRAVTKVIQEVNKFVQRGKQIQRNGRVRGLGIIVTVPGLQRGAKSERGQVR